MNCVSPCDGLIMRMPASLRGELAPSVKVNVVEIVKAWSMPSVAAVVPLSSDKRMSSRLAPLPGPNKLSLIVAEPGMVLLLVITSVELGKLLKTRDSVCSPLNCCANAHVGIATMTPTMRVLNALTINISPVC